MGCTRSGVWLKAHKDLHVKEVLRGCLFVILSPVPRQHSGCCLFDLFFSKIRIEKFEAGRTLSMLDNDVDVFVLVDGHVV